MIIHPTLLLALQPALMDRSSNEQANYDARPSYLPSLKTFGLHVCERHVPRLPHAPRTARLSVRGAMGACNESCLVPPPVGVGSPQEAVAVHNPQPQWRRFCIALAVALTTSADSGEHALVGRAVAQRSSNLELVEVWSSHYEHCGHCYATVVVSFGVTKARVGAHDFNTTCQVQQCAQ